MTPAGTNVWSGTRPAHTDAVTHRARLKDLPAYAKSLSPQQRGALVLVLWINAVLTLALGAAQLTLVVRALRRAARHGHPVATCLDCALSPSTATVLGASVIHNLARERLLRHLDQRIRETETADQAR